MEPTHIAAILAALANGDDPFTGLPLPAGHAMLDVRVKAALAAAAGMIDPEMTLDAVVWREPEAERERDEPARHGQAWSDAELERLIAGHDAGRSPGELARELERTPGGVRSRLVMLGLIAVHTEKGDARFLEHFERGQMLARCVDDAAVRRAEGLLAAVDPDGAKARLQAALAHYRPRTDAAPG